MGCKGSRVQISASRPTLTSVCSTRCVHLCVHFSGRQTMADGKSSRIDAAAGQLAFKNHRGANKHFRCSRYVPHLAHVEIMPWGWLVLWRGEPEQLILAGAVERAWFKEVGKSEQLTGQTEFGDKVTLHRR